MFAGIKQSVWCVSATSCSPPPTEWGGERSRIFIFEIFNYPSASPYLHVNNNKRSHWAGHSHQLNSFNMDWLDFNLDLDMSNELQS